MNGTRPVAGRPRPQRPPVALIIPAVVGAALFTVPVAGLAAKAPWTRLSELLLRDVVLDALRLSVISSTAAALLSLAIGVPLAWVLSRVRFPGRSLVRALTTLPMVLPPVVGGAALLFTLGRRGPIGGPVYDSTGFLLPFSIWGVIVANTFVAMPFLVVTVSAALDGLDGRHEAAAATLGASRLRVFRTVTLPMIAPSLRAGVTLAWARALGEFGATVTFAGNLRGRTQTLPLTVFVALESDLDTAIAISLLMMATSLLVLITMRRRWWARP